jgi:hypothetical protein
MANKNAQSWYDRGYRFDHSGECQACHAKVEYWRTPGKRAETLAVLNADNFEPHFASCEAARDLRMDQRLKAGVL